MEARQVAASLAAIRNKTDRNDALYGAAHALITRSDAWSVLEAWGLRLAKVRGHRRAVIAVARKLAVILHRMWSDETEFRFGRNPAAALAAA